MKLSILFFAIFIVSIAGAEPRFSGTMSGQDSNGDVSLEIVGEYSTCTARSTYSGTCVRKRDFLYGSDGKPAAIFRETEDECYFQIIYSYLKKLNYEDEVTYSKKISLESRKAAAKFTNLISLATPECPLTVVIGQGKKGRLKLKEVKGCNP